MDGIKISAEELHALSYKMSAVIAKDYPHLIKEWKNILGGCILPEIAKSGAGSSGGIEETIKKYSKDSLDSKKVHRRIKGKVNKVSRKKRPLTPSERDLVIKVFNVTQDLIDNDLEIFKSLVSKINLSRSEEDKIAAPQLAGYWSSLCRWAHSTKMQRDHWIQTSIDKGVFSIEPLYTKEFINKIITNSLSRREEARKREEDHRKIREEREKYLFSGESVESAESSEVLEGSAAYEDRYGYEVIDLADIL